MEATFCLRLAAIGVSPKSRLPDAAAVRPSRLRDGVIRRVSFSSAAPPPASKDSGERRRKVVRAAGGPSGMDGGPGAPRGHGAPGGPGAPDGVDGGGVDIPIEDFGPKTPLLIAKMLLPELKPEPELPGGGKNPSAILLQHFYSNVLSPDKQLKLMEYLIVRKDKSPVPHHELLPPIERIEAALALAQIYFDKKDYKNTKEVMLQLFDPKTNKPIVTSDARIYFIQAITCMMLALELPLVPEGKNMEEEKKRLNNLIAEAQNNWKYFKELVEMLPLSAPSKIKDDSNN